MKKIQITLASLILVVLTLSISISPLTRLASAHHGDSPKLTYPETRRVNVVDTYFGTSVPDPYRWLEDDNSPKLQPGSKLRIKLRLDISTRFLIARSLKIA